MAYRGAGGVIGVCFLTIALGSTASAQAPTAAAATPAPAARAPAKAGPDLAAFLVKPAQQAMAKRNYAMAIAVYRGIVAMRGDGDAAALELVKAWQLAGQQDAAIEQLEKHRDALADPEAKKKAEARLEEIRAQAGLGAFGAANFKVPAAAREATEAFKRGRKAFAKKQYQDAILYYKAGYAMAPDMPGNLRELGASYDALGRGAEAEAFFVEYLTMRPFGKNADQVRQRLLKTGIVGKIDVESSLPCELVMVNRQVVPVKLPIKGLVVAPGKYKWLCYSPKFHHAQYEATRVVKAGEAKVFFAWSILENKLDPWGRVVLESPIRAGEMNDVGLFDELGVPVPADRRALKVQMRAGDGSKRKEMLLKLEPGKRYKLEW